MSRTLIRFNAGTDFLSSLIRWRTGSRFNHCDFVLPDGTLLGAVPGVGVTRHSVGAEKAFALYEVEIENGYEYAISQMRKPYDFGAIVGLGLPFPRNWQSDDKWFCSELLAASLFKAGMPVVSSQSWGVTPRDLLLSPLFKPVNQPF